MPPVDSNTPAPAPSPAPKKPGFWERLFGKKEAVAPAPQQESHTPPPNLDITLNEPTDPTLPPEPAADNEGKPPTVQVPPEVNAADPTPMPGGQSPVGGLNVGQPPVSPTTATPVPPVPTPQTSDSSQPTPQTTPQAPPQSDAYGQAAYQPPSPEQKPNDQQQ